MHSICFNDETYRQAFHKTTEQIAYLVFLRLAHHHLSCFSNSGCLLCAAFLRCAVSYFILSLS